jgi:NitT/TauT family transport system ATP-binding protein
MGEPKIRARGVAKHYRANNLDVRALGPLDLEIYEGEFVCLLGPSGCGKSTLLRMVAGLVTPTSGTLHMDGRLITKPAPERGLVFQEYALFPWMTVLRNVMYGPSVRGLGRATAEKLAGEKISRVGLEGFENHFAS